MAATEPTTGTAPFEDEVRIDAWLDGPPDM